MVCRLLLSMLALAGCTRAPDTPAATMVPEARVVEPDSLVWQPSWPGTQMAVVRGAPFREGEFVFRFRMPAGYWIHPHRHPVDAHIRVLTGSFLVGMGTTLDSAAVRTLSPGDAIALGRGMPHYEGTRMETVIEVTGTGPWGISFIDPTKDPARAGAVGGAGTAAQSGPRH
jgi:quercetin dioxygenase-like cupin family protein